jgi:hypothetical protein
MSCELAGFGQPISSPEGLRSLCFAEELPRRFDFAAFQVGSLFDVLHA